MADNCLDTFNLAEEMLRQGKFEDALGAYLKVLRGSPWHWRTRFRIADTLLNLKAPQYSLEIYKNIGLHAVQSGLPLWGLVAIKMAAAMDRSQADLVHVIASLYGKDSTRLERSGPPAQRKRLRKEDPVGDIGFLSGPRLIEAAGQEAAQVDGSNAAGKLPAIPLFSLLDEEAFGAVLEALVLRRYVKGQKIITEGQPGDSFFIIAEGDVSITRNVGGKEATLARLQSGAVFGEMALISKAPRTASVITNDDCEVLELKRASLEDQAHRLAVVTKALQQFMHDRLLSNLTATNPIFKALPPSIRAEVIKKFKDEPMKSGDVLIAENDEGKGLFMLLKGQIEVQKRGADGKPIHLANLKEGEVFGEISLLQATATTASCIAKSDGQLLFLPKREFNSVMARQPELKDQLSKITADRLKQQKEKMQPGGDDFTLIEDDDLIML